MTSIKPVKSVLESLKQSSSASPLLGGNRSNRSLDSTCLSEGSCKSIASSANHSEEATSTSKNFFPSSRSFCSAESVDSSTDAIRRSAITPIVPHNTRKSARDATRDFTINKLRFDCLGYHGRSHETQQLQDCFEGLVQGKTQSHFVTLSGYSGAGKSSLAATLKTSVKKQQDTTRGAFAGGKFDQAIRDKPYQCFVSVLQDICRGILDTLKKQSIPSRSQEDATKNNSTSNNNHFDFDGLQQRIFEEVGATEFTELVGAFPALQIFEMATPVVPATVKTSSRELTARKGPSRGDSSSFLDSSGRSNTTGGISNRRASFLSSSARSRHSGKQIVDGKDSILESSEDRSRAKRLGGFSSVMHRAASQETNLGLVEEEKTAVDYDSSQEYSETFRKAQFENKYRFNRSFCSLMHVLSAFFPVMVLVLDDLQWADSSSLDLLKDLLSSSKCKLLVVGTYRSNEVDETHVLSRTLQEIRQHIHCEESSSTRAMTEIEVGKLSVKAVHEILQDLLASDEPKIARLAEICHKKTDGNAFYLIHFVSMLYESHMLEYNLGTMKWNWQEEEIENLIATQNVVDVLKQQMSLLCEESQLLLQLASFLGFMFEKRSLLLLWKGFHPGFDGVEEEDMGVFLGEALEKCEDAGFLEGVTETTYRWVHDKVQESAMQMVPPEERLGMSERVADILYTYLSDVELEAALFVVVNRYNEKPPDDSDDIKRLLLAKLNLRAAKKAVMCSSFQTAANYCLRGIDMLDARSWDDQYNLCLSLYSLGAETECLLGDHHRMTAYCDQVLQHGNDHFRDKFRVYTVLMNSLSNGNQPDEAKDVCLEVLQGYGNRFPRSASMILVRILANIVRCKRDVKHRTEADANKLPMMTSKTQLEQMELFLKLSTYCYIAEDDLMPLGVFKAVRWTLKHGVCTYSPPAFAATGMIFAGVLEDFASGRVYGEYALNLWKRLDAESAKVAEARTTFIVYAFCFPWTAPMQSSIRPLMEGYEAGIRYGDIENAMFCAYASTVYSLYSGKPLGGIEQAFRAYSEQMKELKQLKILDDCLVTWQVVLNLMGKSPDSTKRTTLTGDAMNEDKHLAIPNKFHKALLQAYRVIIHSWYGEYEMAVKLALEEGDSLKENQPGTPLVAQDAFHRGISLFAESRRLKWEGQRGHKKYAKTGKSILRKFHGWVKQGNPNVRHHELLLAAEYAAYRGQTNVAKQRYNAAATLAGRGGFMQDCALAYERHGAYLESLKCPPRARLGNNNDGPTASERHLDDDIAFQYQQSIKLYREWGALGKVQRMEEELSCFRK